MDFGLVLEGLGEVLGGFGPSKMGPKRAPAIFSIELGFSRDLGRVWGGCWEALGRVWGGFWEGLGRFWDGFGRV